MTHSENCIYWQDGYCTVLKKETNDGASCQKGVDK